jgi:hypothetical protein
LTWFGDENQVTLFGDIYQSIGLPQLLAKDGWKIFSDMIDSYRSRLWSGMNSTSSGMAPSVASFGADWCLLRNVNRFYSHWLPYTCVASNPCWDSKLRNSKVIFNF